MSLDIDAALAVKAASETFGIPEADILGRRRFQAVADARQAAVAITREVSGLSTNKLGRTFGIDHSTVIWATNAVISKCETEPAFRAKVEKIRKAMGK
jgi:chromosomal replication initiator protein